MRSRRTSSVADRADRAVLLATGSSSRRARSGSLALSHLDWDWGDAEERSDLEALSSALSGESGGWTAVKFGDSPPALLWRHKELGLLSRTAPAALLDAVVLDDGEDSPDAAARATMLSADGDAGAALDAKRAAAAADAAGAQLCDSNDWWWVAADDSAVGFFPAQLVKLSDDAATASVASLFSRGPPLTLAAARLAFPLQEPASVADAPAELSSLDDVNEATLLAALAQRFRRRQIYTTVGPLLLSVNPLAWLQELYTTEVADKYQLAEPGDELPPHLFHVASNALAAATLGGQARTLLLGGDSGAGKSEASKKCLQFLLDRCAGGSRMHDATLALWPVLEALCNAHTPSNANSSCGTVMLKLTVGQDARLRAVDLSLLFPDISRVTHRPPSQRNFHIFYQMCAVATSLTLPQTLARCQLRCAEHYALLKFDGQADTFDRAELRADFHDREAAAKQLGYTDVDLTQLYALLACVLHLGNVQFAADDDGKLSIADGSSAAALATAAGLLVMPVEELTTLLCRGLSLDAARHQLHLLCQTLFAATLRWQVQGMNELLQEIAAEEGIPPPPPPAAAGAGAEGDDDAAAACGSITIVDALSFSPTAAAEPAGGLSQLLQNAVAEELHAAFLHSMFEAEREVMEAEGLAWQSSKYRDNGRQLAALCRDGGGVLPTLARLASTTDATDGSVPPAAATLLTSSATTAGGTAGVGDASGTFTLKHSGATAAYDASALLSQAGCTLPLRLSDLLAATGIEELATLLEKRDACSLFTWMGAAPSAWLPGASAAAVETADTPLAAAQAGMRHLCLHVLREVRMQHILCLRPAPPGSTAWHGGHLLTQMHRHNLVAVAELQHNDYSCRTPLQLFLRRYRVMLLPEERERVEAMPLTEGAAALLNLLADSALEGVVVGRSAVLYRSEQHATLERLRHEALYTASSRLAGLVRGRRARQRARDMRNAKNSLLKALDSERLEDVDNALYAAFSAGFMSPLVYQVNALRLKMVEASGLADKLASLTEVDPVENCVAIWDAVEKAERHALQSEALPILLRRLEEAQDHIDCKYQLVRAAEEAEESGLDMAIARHRVLSHDRPGFAAEQLAKAEEALRRLKEEEAPVLHALESPMREGRAVFRRGAVQRGAIDVDLLSAEIDKVAAFGPRSPAGRAQLASARLLLRARRALLAEEREQLMDALAEAADMAATGELWTEARGELLETMVLAADNDRVRLQVEAALRAECAGDASAPALLAAARDEVGTLSVVGVPVQALLDAHAALGRMRDAADKQYWEDVQDIAAAAGGADGMPAVLQDAVRELLAAANSDIVGRQVLEALEEGGALGVPGDVDTSTIETERLQECCEMGIDFGLDTPVLQAANAMLALREAMMMEDWDALSSALPEARRLEELLPEAAVDELMLADSLLEEHALRGALEAALLRGGPYSAGSRQPVKTDGIDAEALLSTLASAEARVAELPADDEETKQLQSLLAGLTILQPVRASLVAFAAARDSDSDDVAEQAAGLKAAIAAAEAAVAAADDGSLPDETAAELRLASGALAEVQHGQALRAAALVGRLTSATSMHDASYAELEAALEAVDKLDYRVVTPLLRLRSEAAQLLRDVRAGLLTSDLAAAAAAADELRLLPLQLADATEEELVTVDAALSTWRLCQAVEEAMQSGAPLGPPPLQLRNVRLDALDSALAALPAADSEEAKEKLSDAAISRLRLAAAVRSLRASLLDGPNWSAVQLALTTAVASGCELAVVADELQLCATAFVEQQLRDELDAALTPDGAAAGLSLAAVLVRAELCGPPEDEEAQMLLESGSALARARAAASNGDWAALSEALLMCDAEMLPMDCEDELYSLREAQMVGEARTLVAAALRDDWLAVGEAAAQQALNNAFFAAEPYDALADAVAALRCMSNAHAALRDGDNDIAAEAVTALEAMDAAGDLRAAVDRTVTASRAWLASPDAGAALLSALTAGYSFGADGRMDGPGDEAVAALQAAVEGGRGHASAYVAALATAGQQLLAVWSAGSAGKLLPLVRAVATAVAGPLRMLAPAAERLTAVAVALEEEVNMTLNEGMSEAGLLCDAIADGSSPADAKQHEQSAAVRQPLRQPLAICRAAKWDGARIGLTGAATALAKLRRSVLLGDWPTVRTCLRDLARQSPDALAAYEEETMWVEGEAEAAGELVAAVAAAKGDAEQLRCSRWFGSESPLMQSSALALLRVQAAVTSGSYTDAAAVVSELGSSPLWYGVQPSLARARLLPGLAAMLPSLAAAFPAPLAYSAGVLQAGDYSASHAAVTLQAVQALRAALGPLLPPMSEAVVAVAQAATLAAIRKAAAAADWSALHAALVAAVDRLAGCGSAPLVLADVQALADSFPPAQSAIDSLRSAAAEQKAVRGKEHGDAELVEELRVALRRASSCVATRLRCRRALQMSLEFGDEAAMLEALRGAKACHYPHDSFLNNVMQVVGEEEQHKDGEEDAAEAAEASELPAEEDKTAAAEEEEKKEAPVASTVTPVVIRAPAADKSAAAAAAHPAAAAATAAATTAAAAAAAPAATKPATAVGPVVISSEGGKSEEGSALLQHAGLRKATKALSAAAVTEWVSYQPETIKRSVLGLSELLTLHARKTFTALMVVMGDARGSKSAAQTALELCSKLLHSPPLRDEAFAHIVKQVTDNPDDSGCRRAWRLLSLYLSLFPPTSAMAPVLSQFIAAAAPADQAAALQSALQERLASGEAEEMLTMPAVVVALQ